MLENIFNSFQKRFEFHVNLKGYYLKNMFAWNNWLWFMEETEASHLT